MKAFSAFNPFNAARNFCLLIKKIGQPFNLLVLLTNISGDGKMAAFDSQISHFRLAKMSIFCLLCKKGIVNQTFE